MSLTDTAPQPESPHQAPPALPVASFAPPSLHARPVPLPPPSSIATAQFGTMPEATAQSQGPQPTAGPLVPTLPTLPPTQPRPSGPPPVTATVPPLGAGTHAVFGRAAQPGLPGGPRPPVVGGRESRGPRFSLYFKVRLTIGIVGLIIALAMGATKNGMFQSGDASDPQRAEVEAWDPRVTDIVAFVERERGWTFEHPIDIDFQAEADFIAGFSTESDDPEADAEMNEMYAKYSKVYNAFGLAANYDMAEGESTVSSVSTLGFYSPEEDKIFVRGDELTAAVRVVLAHELTHALQAQHFDITLGGPDDFALRSIVEADALRVEKRYQETLPKAEQTDATEDNTLDDGEASGLSSVPWAVVEQRYAPYVLGPMLVNTVYESKGNRGVDELISDPPPEEVLISPWLLGTGQADADVNVSVPASGAVLLSPQPMSMLDLLVMLDAWLPWKQARGALDGWAGGGYAVYESGGEGGPVCFASTVMLDGPADALASAISDWAMASGSAAVPALDGNQVSFEACDRGTAAVVPPDPVVYPLDEIVLENDFVSDAGPNATPEMIGQAQCYARTLIDDPSLGPLVYADELTPDQQAIVTWVTTTASQICGTPPT